MTLALITGGAGFVGSHLADALLAEGQNVVALDDLSTGATDNVSHLMDHPSFRLVRGSATDPATLAPLVQRADVVFHLAAAVGVRLIVERPVHTIKTNIQATELVLDLAALSGVPVLIASTSEVYGKLDKEQFNEEDDLVLGPTSHWRWCYAASKIIDEFLARAYWREQGLPTVIVRLFNTIGPRQTGQYGMVVPRFVGQALRNEPITVYGDGTQRRAFTWVGDVVRALVALVREPRAYGEVFNVGQRQDISILELAELIRDMAGSTSEIRLVPLAEAYEEGFEDMQRRVPDISKIERTIGYRPSKDLRSILEQVIAHERQRMAAVGAD